MSKPKCDQCDSATIQGVYCHETGCVNAKKVWNEEEQKWVDPPFECEQCGDTMDEYYLYDGEKICSSCYDDYTADDFPQDDDDLENFWGQPDLEYEQYSDADPGL